MRKKYDRVPVVTRWEYEIALLEGVQWAESAEALEKRLATIKLEFEVSKYKALGRGNPFEKGLKKANYLLYECVKLGLELGYLQRNGELSLTKDGGSLLASDSTHRETLFCDRFVNTYPAAIALLLALRDAPNQELSFPDMRTSKRAAEFRAYAAKYAINAGLVSFVTMRDILAHAGLINWFREKKAEGEYPHWIIYLTSEVTDSETSDKSIAFEHSGRSYSIRRRKPGDNEFVDVLWTQYLKKTRSISLKPVFYSDLRMIVCHKLKISDTEFDAALKKLIGGPTSGLRIITSYGTLPYDRDSANLLKNLPPKISNEEYLVYLKIGLKSAS